MKKKNGGIGWTEAEEERKGRSNGDGGDDIIVGLWKEVRELSLGFGTSIERLHQPPSALEFLRNYVAPNKPCIISNAIRHWPAFSTWPKRLGTPESEVEAEVSVHLTPHGRADSLVPHPHNPSTLCFASGHVQRMPFSLALRHIASPPFPNYVAYAQEQNDCFRSEYSFLAPDVDAHIPWATQAFGCLPEAVNLWIGNHLSHTSFHKDHYENIYAVVSGKKHFLLLPPTDVHRIYIRHYPAARYSFSQESGEFDLQLESPPRSVPWCSVNPYPSSLMDEEEQVSSFPLYFNGPKPFECTLEAGEILYL